MIICFCCYSYYFGYVIIFKYIDDLLVDVKGIYVIWMLVFYIKYCYLVDILFGINFL